MDNQMFINICKRTVADYFNSNVKGSNQKCISTNEVYIVWLCKVLQNNKAVLSTSLKDGTYYEITYNGDKDQLYLNAYRKVENMCIEADGYVHKS